MQKKFNIHIQIHYINYILLVEATLIYDKFMVFGVIINPIMDRQIDMNNTTTLSYN